MAEVSNIFDLVPAQGKEDTEQARPSSSRRLCTYRSRLGTLCPRDASEGGLVCDMHGGSKMSLVQLRREAVNLGPMALITLEELMVSEIEIVRLGAVKQWMDWTGAKDLPIGSGIEEEELDAARRSLQRKLESVAERVLQRKTA